MLDSFKVTLDKFLSKIPNAQSTNNNEIAFLGDYFDKGPGVVDSIIGIAYLHQKHPGKVHIILGNRDVNKLRFIKEMGLTLSERQITVKKWKTWEVFHNGFDKGFEIEDSAVKYFDQDKLKEESKLALFHFIGKNSMGAMSNESEKIIHSQLDNEKSMYWLLSIFSGFDLNDDYEPDFAINIVDNIDEYKKLFVWSCRYLFRNGELVKILPRFSVILSHAGGFDSSILRNSEFFDGIKGIIESKDLYYDKIESARKLLADENDINEVVEKVVEKVSISDAVTLHNGIFRSVIDSLIDEEYRLKNGDLPVEYYLLQAMGLKPNNGDYRFASFIHSCGGGCGFSRFKGKINKSTEEYLQAVKDGDIKAIAYGHAPMCLRHPLIYKRSITESEIVFIENDTSNGNRIKLENGEMSDLPLSFIKKTIVTLMYGVGSVNNNGDIKELKTYDIKSDGNKYLVDESSDTFKKLALDDSGPKTMDLLLTSEEIENRLKFNSFNPTDIVKGGGKRKSRKNNKKSKYYKKFISNGRRTRKSKRKTKCNHGCKH